MRAPLADMVAAGEQPFWRTDTHWSSVGTAVLARRLAERLDPALAARLEVRKGQRSKTGDLTLLAGLDFDEEAASADVSAGGEVRESAGSDHWDEGTPVYGTHRWTTAPSAGLVPGRTALVGDSFTYFALGNLRPLFAEGEFLWIAHPVAQAQIVAGIVDADTVVLETVQRSLTRSLLVSDTFYLAVKKALAADVSPD
ncbi:hypothetical protein [Nocardioides convexus]|uniref:alginate O-acetyltransferase AlgX-related protein n=1 Tax=Nocardioides convexus TaxID=2712224 RepID=UPI003100E35D